MYWLTNQPIGLAICQPSPLHGLSAIAFRLLTCGAVPLHPRLYASVRLRALTCEVR